MTSIKSQIKRNVQNHNIPIDFKYLKIDYWRLFAICILLFGA